MPQFLAAFLLLGASGEGDEPAARDAAFAFRKGDHVCLLGNELAERMQHDGWFETLLHERLPDHELSLRNLGFSGDELSVHQRVEGFGSWDDHLARCRASVVLAFFGWNESFGGDAGLEPFRRDLLAFVDHTLAARYDGASAPRLVLLSSIPFEDRGRPLLPDGREQNERIREYADVMADVARDRGVPFVDLFTPMEKAYAASSAPLTLNGIHLDDQGDRLLAGILVSALCGPDTSRRDESRREKLRQVVLEKDLLWFNRYQTTDGYNVHGGRSALAYSDNVSNFDVLQREMAILDAMADRRDRRIWALAQGRDEPVDDSNLPPKIAVRTNLPGPKPDGSHEFLDGEAAIRLMTPAPGMKVGLFADEKRFPQLANPVQMAWDARGRLWVAAWPTYPHWEPGQPMCDKLLILEDLDRDGRADVCRTFAGDLRNPTGFEFWNGGVFVAQAPDLVFLRDVDGDDVADERELVLHGLSTADTHHTANSFVFGPDGALYFQEGTFHQSQIETIWGPERNHDACVWRFEPRTWRVERHVAYNFANPHGHVFDRWGQEFVTDGTGNDNYYALAFSGRVVHPQKHAGYFTFFQQRSRPCAGTEILSSCHFPPENQGNLLLCNVIGFQGIFQYHFVEEGSGFNAREVDPVVFSSDPRFRPSDVEVGPDGALYFLDWYNPIIGHMQHHLRDPNRDHDHGRVYRVTCEGRPLLEPRPVEGQPVAALLELLKEPEDRVRYRARFELSRHDSKEVVAAARAWAARLDRSDPEFEHHRLEALWLQEQHATLDEPLLDELLRSRDPRVRAAATHVLRFERRSAHEPLARLRELANDPHPRVRLEAVVAASFFDEPEAAIVALEALRHPTDRFIDYALGETMRTLEPVWRRALKDGQLPLADNSAGVAWLVERCTEEELARLPRVAPVLEALLARHGPSLDQRRAAADELAALRGTRRATELLGAMQTVDRAGGDHARHVQHDLGTLLLEAVAAGEVERDLLVALAKPARLPETGAFALAACILRDGEVERTWRESAASLQKLLSFLGALDHVGGPLAEKAWPRVRPLMFAPKSTGEASAAAMQAPAGLLVSYYPTRLRTAAREGFSALHPAETRVVDVVGVELAGLEKSDSFALRFQARLRIERAGEYRFHLESDDGSRLYVDGQLVVDNDGDHGVRELTGTCRLEPGVHALELCYFDQAGYEALRLDWTAPGGSRQPIPRERLEAATRDLLRPAAIRAVAALPGHDDEKAADALLLLKERAFVAEALELLAAIPDSAWSAKSAAPAVDAVAELARAVPAEERTRSDVIAALELGRRLAGHLPDAAARSRRRELDELRGSIVLIRTVPHQMLFDRREFSVAAGKPVALVFQNNDLMPHNLVVVAPGALESVGTAAEAMATQPLAQEKSFIPDRPDVLHRLRLLLPGESMTLRFVAPERPGDYPYVCTFPGHWRVMNGVMHVVEHLDPGVDGAGSADVAAIDADSSPAIGRSFVRMWALDDFQPSLAAGWERGRSLERGRAHFTEAGCMKCHWFRGEGIRSAPDLTEVTKKYRGAELLKQILEPSAVILEGYENHLFLLNDGRDLFGRIVKEDDRSFHIAPNFQEPDRLELVPKAELESKRKSPLSAMPTGLLVTFTRDEILDLVAFLQSDPPAKDPGPADPRSRADGGP